MFIKLKTGKCAFLWALFLLLKLHNAAYSQDPSLINIKDIAPGIRVEMRYASKNNFTGTQLYTGEECLLCEPAAERLARVQKNLEEQGLGLKVWDCYRPLSIQKKLWDLVPDPRYVADPKTGSRHNRGASVDLTLVDKNGVELPMPTLFDEFSEKAHRSYNDLPDNVKKNRQLLQDAMEKEGFIGLETEWWHFDAPEWSQYALRDEALGSKTLLKDKAAPKNSLLKTEVKQLVLVIASTWSATQGQLQRYERSGASWRKVGPSWPVNLGSKGLAWGRGTQSSLAQGPSKTEGDKTAPAGIFKIGKAYGSAEYPPQNTKWEYQPLTSDWICVDDSNSIHYNKVFAPGKNEIRDWNSTETMLRSDSLYKWVINIEQNPYAIKSCGSCVFFHVWRKKGSPTEGCTAMAEENIKRLLTWLDPQKTPTLVQLPIEVYRPLKKRGDLP